jgi:ferritin-like metal-binding protein YciE/hemerythrin superfamily protein
MLGTPSSQPSGALPPLMVDRGCGEPISLGANLETGKKVRPGILGLLQEDHRTVRGWFDWYENEALPPRRAWLAANIVKALTAHMAVEEEIFYPAAAAAISDRDLVDRAIAEHEAAKAIMDQISASGSDADEAMKRLRREIEKHIAEEEGELFPQVRESSLDEYVIGGQCAARRAELLFELSAPRKPVLKETAPMPISREEARDLFIVGLRNIHGTASQCRSMVSAQEARVENYPTMKAKLQSHLAEKDAQLQRVETILEELGDSPSAVKDTTGAVMGAASSLMAAMASDEIIKSTFAAYALANFEAAAYETLLTMGEAAGLPEMLPPLQQSLSEERAMAAFIAENLRATGLRFMQLRSEGQQAGR